MLGGGGGTDFRPVFDWVRAQGLRPDALIYFTEAEGAFPPLPPEYPVLWLVKGRAGRVTAPARAPAGRPCGTWRTSRPGPLDVMGRLRELGGGLSVDDSGTGYWSLAYLSTLPITSLKIDRSFVQRLQHQTSDAEVVKAVITLSHALGKTMIAEGIETPDQLAQLRTLGCSLGQGYLLARPLSPDAAAAVVAVERRWPGPDARRSDFARFVPAGYGNVGLTLH